MKSFPRHHSHVVSILATLALTLICSPAIAQAPAAAPAPAAATASGGKKVLSEADYARWRSIDGAQLSGDGNWVAYGLRFTNVPTADARPVLHIVRLDNGQDTEIPNASGAFFSSDSQWIIYGVEPPAGRGGAAGRGGRTGGAGAGAGAGGGGGGAGGGQAAAPGGAGGAGAGAQGRGGDSTAAAPQRRLELRNLVTGVIRSWQDMQSAQFSPTASHLLLRIRAAGGGGGGAAGGAGAGGAGGGGGGGGRAGGAAPAGNAARGADFLLHDLTDGRSRLLGSVGEISFNDKGDLLAYTVDATARDGNGLFVFDLKTDRIHVLDNDSRNYTRMTWNEDGTALAALKGLEVTRMRERNNVLIAFTDVRAAMNDETETAPAKLDPAKATGFPSGWVVSDRAGLSWSDDKKRIFLGIIKQTPVPDSAGGRGGADVVADVDVWRTQDERIQSVQMTRAEAERNFTFRQAFDVPQQKFIALTDSTMRDIDISLDGGWAVGRDTRGYISDYKRAAADIYRVNTSTGERKLMLKGQLIGGHVFGISTDGHYYLYWKENKYQAYNLDSATSKTLGTGSPVSFVDMQFDHPGPKPSYGVAGYTTDGKGVIVQHRYDLWVLPLDGVTPPRNITNGTGTRGEIRFRYVRTEPADAPGAGGGGGGGGGGRGGGAGARRTIDLSKPVTLSAYGEYTKKAGFYELANGQLREIVYEDASFSTPLRATKADKYMFTRQTFVEFPDLVISGPDFKMSKKITNANPQQSEYAWGRRVLFDFKNKDGLRLQGILALPDDYKPGEKRPMIVTFYEDNSQNMHRYNAPSFIGGMGSSPMEAVSRGYITMLPDVHFRTGSSHTDMLECVEAATKKVIEMGYVDPKRIGLNGHSYGGEGAAFIGTRSRMFAAVGMGAGVTDLFTDFSQSWGWSYQVSGGSGANGNDYYLFGQGRWGISPWDNPDLYHFESALTHVRQTTAPFLIMHGTADPTVSFSEGMNFYNALRYNGKNATLLAYPGEGHSLRGLANRKDLTIRFFQFFDHHLKGAPAPKWMTDGVPFIAKDALKDPRGGP